MREASFWRRHFFLPSVRVAPPGALLPPELCFRLLDIITWFTVCTATVADVVAFNDRTLHFAGDPLIWCFCTATVMQLAAGVWRGWPFLRRFWLLALGIVVEIVCLAVVAGITPNWIMPVVILLVSVELFMGSRAAYLATAVVFGLHVFIGWAWVAGRLPFRYEPVAAIGTYYDFRSAFTWCRVLGFSAGFVLLLLALVRLVLQAVRVSQEKFARAFSASPMAMTISRLSDGRILEANEKIANRYGMTPDQLRNHRSTDIGIWDDVEERKQMVDAFKAQGRIRGWIKESKMPDGGRLIVAISAEPIVIDGENCIISVADDITELAIAQEKAAEGELERNGLMQQLFVAQKLEAVGQLAGGVAHDFNNLLLAMMLHLDVLKLDYGHLPGLGESVDELILCAKRASNLTRQLLLFSRRQPIERQVVEINGLVASLYRMLRRLIEMNIELVHENPTEKIYVFGDPGMIEQIVMNLVINARDAIGGSGRITVTVQRRLITASRKNAVPASRLGGFVAITCSDTGAGMTPETRARVFEPFYTTKGVGKGTGLGLATVLGIVEQHEGWVEFDSELGKGTSFQIFLPDHGPVSEAETSQRVLAKARHAWTETVLVVEDDDTVRQVSAAVLRNAGYTVLEASTADEALGIFAAGATVDLLLTDIVLPGGLLGHQLALRLYHEGIRPKVIFMSGYNSKRDEDGMNLGIHLAKPFSAEEILTGIRRQLDDGGSE